MNKADLKSAEDAGRAAFHNGINAPYHDKLFFITVDGKTRYGPLLEETTFKERMKLMESWSHGWTVENLNQPIPGLIE